MKKYFFALPVLALSCLSSHAQVTLNSGETYARGFDSLPLLSSTAAPDFRRSIAGFSITLDPTSIQPGDSFTMELTYGNTISQIWNGPESSTFLNSFGGPGLFGGMRLTGLSGSVTIESISMSVSSYRRDFTGTFLDYYSETITPIPEPASAVLLLLGLPFLSRKHAKRR